MADGTRTTRPNVNASIRHDSAEKHVSGEARYIDDLPEPPGLLHLAFGMSERAHARLLEMDLSAVRAAPGVVCVLTAADIPGINDVAPVAGDDPLFAVDTLVYVGQSLFCVAAETRALARAAARLARVSYADLPAALTIAQARVADLKIEASQTMTLGDAPAALAAAPRRLSGSLAIGGQDHFYLEGQAALALPLEDGDVRVFSSTQHPTEVQHLIAKVLGRADHAVTVEVRRMGGGFGGKETQASLFAAAAALVAVKTGRAAKARLDRDDDMAMTGKRHDFEVAYDVGFDDDGLLAGISVDLASRCGCSADLSPAINDRAMFHVDNTYFLNNAALLSHRFRTHTVSNTAFRGFGGPQGMMGIERVMDAIALELGRDPLDVRLANLYGPGRDVTPYHQTVEDNIGPDLIARLEATSDYRARRAAILAFNRDNRWQKKGIALTPVKFGISFTTTHLNQAGALVHLYADGSILLNHGGTEMGQGLMIKMAQVAADAFGVALDRVRITATATDKVPNTSATAASSGADLNGMAVADACGKIRQRLADFLAEKHGGSADAVVFGGGEIQVAGKTLAFDDAGQTGLFRPRLAVRDRLLRHAQDPLRPRHPHRPAVPLLRLRRRLFRSHRRRPDRREPRPARRHPARRRPLAESGHRPGPDRGRLHPGHGLADHRGAGVQRQGPPADPRPLDLQDSRLFRPAAGAEHRPL